MLVNLFEPILDVVKCLLISAVVYQNDAHGSFVICLRDGSEALLARCVPHLHLDGLSIMLNLMCRKIHANGRL